MINLYCWTDDNALALLLMVMVGPIHRLVLWLGRPLRVAALLQGLLPTPCRDWSKQSLLDKPLENYSGAYSIHASKLEGHPFVVSFFRSFFLPSLFPSSVFSSLPTSFLMTV